MNLYIVRHGQTIWNQEGRMQGSLNSPLTLRGIEEAKKLNRRLEDMDLDLIYTSPLGRTLETTAHLKGNIRVGVEIIDQLEELDFGILESRKLDELYEQYPEELENLWHRPEKYRTESGENYPEFFARLRQALDKILNSGHENVLIVTHGVVISGLLTILKGGDYDKIWDNPIVKNTSLTQVELVAGKAEIKLLGDTAHLE